MIAVGVCVAIVLFYIERKNRDELYALGSKKKIIEYYLQKLSNIEKIKEDNNKKLDEIKILSKKLFNEYYGLDLNVSYSTLFTFFEQKNNNSLKDFSGIMLNCYYCSKKADNKTIAYLISILKKEVLNIPLEKSVKKNSKILELRLKEEEKRLILETEEHIKNKNHSAAEKTYYKLEEVADNNRYSSKIWRIYDKIINLYYKKKIANEKEFGSMISSQIDSDEIKENKCLLDKRTIKRRLPNLSRRKK